MAISVPTTKEISENLVATISGNIGRSIPLLPKSFTRVLAKALAGLFVIVYKYAGFSRLQMFPQYASFRETVINGKTLTPLIEWGRLVGVGDPQNASRARMTVSFGVTNTDGSTLPAGRQLVFPDSGVIYITLASVVLDAATKQVDVQAASDPDGNGGSGTQGNRENGDVLKWANPIPQLSVDGATVLATVVTAEDAESEESYRARVVDRFGARPQGGAYSDYVAWGLEVEGIINIYPYTGQPGVVEVYAEASETTAEDADGTPTDAQRQAVEDAIEADSGGVASRRPAGTLVEVRKITRAAFDVDVRGLSPDTSDARDIIEEAVDDHLRSREPFITGISRLPRRDRVTVAAVSGIVDEAASSVGASVISVSVRQGAGTLTEYQLEHGEKAKLNGTVNYL